MFAIANMRTCVAIATSDGISETAEVAGGKESVIVPRFDCTISACVWSVSAIHSVTLAHIHSQS